MELVVLGLNHKTAPLEVRERVAFSNYSPETYLTKLSEKSSVQGGLILSTCNRVEVYATGTRVDELLQDATQFLQSFHKLTDLEVQPYLYNRVNRDAVRHIFRVASSLDSMIVGEPQILGQVKDAYYISSNFSFTNPFFDLLMQKTFFVAKKVRTETSVAQQAVSVSYAAVELALKIFGDLKEKSVLILGAGEMAEQAARHLKRKEVKEMVFTNRSYENSVELAKEYGGIPIPFDQYKKYLSKSDVVIVSTAAPHYLIEKEVLEKVMEERNQDPIFLIDISVPRNVDPRAGELENVFLYNIDDLQKVVQENIRLREQESQKAEDIISMEVNHFYKSAGKLELSPIIMELQEKYDQLTKSEMERLESRLRNLDISERAEIERSMKTVVRKMLNDPILYLKSDNEEQKSVEKTKVILEVFALGKLVKKDTDEK